MDFPVQISYRNVAASPTVEEWVRKEAEKLATFHPRIVRCRVAIDLDHQHLRRGNRFLVKLLLSVPGGQVAARNLAVVVDSEKLLEAGRKAKRLEIGAPQKELRLAIASAFRSAGRRLQDLVRQQRRQVKTHEQSLGQVVEVSPDLGYGFLETPEGQRIYFHRNSVLHDAFSGLVPGAMVRFVEEEGERGPQASTVQLVRRGHERKRLHKAA
ncbi:MAG TPA: HPF/RaiA family ribosome-associated protein [Candidatus Acidoferrales bacterium]|nr:HPF/RaiA family ribosome-associated protein [Candidatus Acidoferrales bacterium]